jgi:hypothetical protein
MVAAAATANAVFFMREAFPVQRAPTRKAGDSFP